MIVTRRRYASARKLKRGSISMTVEAEMAGGILISSQETLQTMDSINLRLIYDGIGPIHWSRKPAAFGLQDKAGVLHVGAPGPNGTVVFDFTLQVKPGNSDAPVLVGSFAHGPPSGRFLYLGWRDKQGALAQRLKLPLSGIAWNDIRSASSLQKPLVGTLVDRHPKVTSTGANIGGTRPMSWTLP